MLKWFAILFSSGPRFVRTLSTMTSPLDRKEIKAVSLKEINLEYSLEGLMLKLKFQYFGHLIRRADSLEKTLMLGKTERQGEKGMTEDEMVGWHHWLNGRDFEPALGNGEEQGSLVCYSSWDHKGLVTTEQLNNIYVYIHMYISVTLQCLIFGFENQTSPLDGFQSIEDAGPWGWIFKGFQRAEANLEFLKEWDVGDGRRTRTGESLRTKSGTRVLQKLYWAAAQNSQKCSGNLGRLRRDLPGSSAGKESSCNAGDPGSIPGIGRSHEERIGYTHCSILAWRIPWTV